MQYRCAECGVPITLGDDFWVSPVSGERMFCTPECMRDWIRDSDKLDSVIEDWMEDNSEWNSLEAEDPYDRYGVSESDFH